MGFFMPDIKPHRDRLKNNQLPSITKVIKSVLSSIKEITIVMLKVHKPYHGYCLR